MGCPDATRLRHRQPSRRRFGEERPTGCILSNRSGRTQAFPRFRESRDRTRNCDNGDNRNYASRRHAVELAGGGEVDRLIDIHRECEKRVFTRRRGVRGERSSQRHEGHQETRCSGAKRQNSLCAPGVLCGAKHSCVPPQASRLRVSASKDFLPHGDRRDGIIGGSTRLSVDLS